MGEFNNFFKRFWDTHGEQFKYFLGTAAESAATNLAKTWLASRRESDKIEED